MAPEHKMNTSGFYVVLASKRRAGWHLLERPRRAQEASHPEFLVHLRIVLAGRNCTVWTDETSQPSRCSAKPPLNYPHGRGRHGTGIHLRPEGASPPIQLQATPGTAGPDTNAST